MMLARSVASDSPPAAQDTVVGNTHGALALCGKEDTCAIDHNGGPQFTAESVGGVGADGVSPTALGLEPQSRISEVSPPSILDAPDSESTGSSSTLRTPPPPLPPPPPPPPSLLAATEEPSSSSLIDAQPNPCDLEDDDFSDSSAESGSDYSEQMALERQKRADKVGHSDVDYSEQDDEDEDRRLEDDVVPESDEPAANQSGARRHKSSRATKGKTRKDRQQSTADARKKKNKGKEREVPDDPTSSTGDPPAPSDAALETGP